MQDTNGEVRFRKRIAASFRQAIFAYKVQLFKKNKIEIFRFDLLDCEEKSSDSGAIFDIRIAKGFHL